MRSGEGGRASADADPSPLPLDDDDGAKGERDAYGSPPPPPPPPPLIRTPPPISSSQRLTPLLSVSRRSASDASASSEADTWPSRACSRDMASSRGRTTAGAPRAAGALAEPEVAPAPAPELGAGAAVRVS